MKPRALRPTKKVERRLERAFVLVESFKFSKKANSSNRKFTFPLTCGNFRCREENLACEGVE